MPRWDNVGPGKPEMIIVAFAAIGIGSVVIGLAILAWFLGAPH